MKLRAILAIATSLAIAAPVVAAEVDQTFMEKLMAVLDAHPEIAMSAVERGRAKAEANAQKRAEEASKGLYASLSAPVPGQPIIGSPAARHTVVELLDYQCGYCKVMHPRMKDMLARRPDTRIVVVMTPVLGPASVQLAKFALAADEQGKFAVVHDALYSHEGRLTGGEEELQAIAKKTGLDWASAKVAMEGKAVKERMDQTQVMWNQLNRPGTPFIIAAGKVFPGAVELEPLMASLPPVKIAAR